jgi:hypothetical protein
MAPPLFTSALDGDEKSPSVPGRFAPGQRAPGLSFDTKLTGPQSRFL